MKKLLPALAACVACTAYAPLAIAQQVATHEHTASLPVAAGVDQRDFQHEMGEAMRRMDEGMAIRHSGDADRDFAAMMIPHHQGAVDMAKAELQYGRDPVLRRLAQGIIVEQQQEIELMRRRLKELPAPQALRAPASERKHPAHFSKE